MKTIIGACITAASLASCAVNDFGRGSYGYGGNDRGRVSQRKHLRDDDRIYRHRDGRYYCKRDDGSEGTIVGALAGGLLGNVIAPGDSKTIGTILGAGAGAIAGRAIDRDSEVHCE